MIALLAASVTVLLLSAALYFRKGVLSLAAILPVTALAAFLLKGEYSGITIILCSAALGILGGLVFKHQKSLQFFLLTASCILSLFLTGEYLVAVYVQKMDTALLMNSISVEKSKTQNVETEEDAAEAKLQAEMAANVIKYAVPFSIFFTALMLSLAGYFISRIFLVLAMRAEALKRGLEYFRLNEWLIYLLIASLAIMIFIKGDMETPAKIAALNIILIMALLYFVQALGIIKFFLVKKRLPVMLLPLSFIILGIISKVAVGFSLFILSGYGALDIWTDFRKLNSETKDTPGDNGDS